MSPPEKANLANFYYEMDADLTPCAASISPASESSHMNEGIMTADNLVVNGLRIQAASVSFGVEEPVVGYG